MKPYYEHSGITIYHARCEEAMRQLPDNSVDLIATDPPYFRVKNEPWDRQWDTARGFVEWIGTLCQEWRRILKPNGSLYVFASPDMSARVETKIGEYFNVLNNVRWLKDQGWHKKADEEILRSYLSPWEAVIFAEQWWSDDTAEDGAGYYSQCKALHKNVYAPIGRYIQLERERAGLTRNDVEVGLGYVSSGDPTRGTALCYRWEEGSSLPTKETYERLRALMNARAPYDYLRREYEDLRREYEDLRREYEDLRREYEDLRRPFALNGLREDVWRFATVPAYDGKHPCEKPLAMMEHIIKTSSRPGDTVLDCFMGSGSTLRAARRLNRKAIGIDYVEGYCETAARLLSPTFGAPLKKATTVADLGPLFAMEAL
jgi:adenine-specific DNA-methyltransferase